MLSAVSAAAVATEEGPAALPSVGEGAAVSAASAVSGAGGGGVGESIHPSEAPPRVPSRQVLEGLGQLKVSVSQHEFVNRAGKGVWNSKSERARALSRSGFL
jgi:hypothetical protein